MNRNKIVTLLSIVIIGIFLVYPFIQMFFEKKHDSMLNLSSTKELAVLSEIHIPKVIHGSYYCRFKYSVGKKIYHGFQNGNFSRLKIGDTILIEYAKEDPSVARVVDKYYMKKHRHLKR